MIIYIYIQMLAEAQKLIQRPPVPSKFIDFPALIPLSPRLWLCKLVFSLSGLGPTSPWIPCLVGLGLRVFLIRDCTKPRERNTTTQKHQKNKLISGEDFRHLYYVGFVFLFSIFWSYFACISFSVLATFAHISDHGKTQVKPPTKTIENHTL